MGADQIEEKRLRFDRVAGDIKFHCLLQNFVYVATHALMSPNLIQTIVASSSCDSNNSPA
jgi:hypothetical protein